MPKYHAKLEAGGGRITVLCGKLQETPFGFRVHDKHGRATVYQRAEVFDSREDAERYIGGAARSMVVRAETTLARARERADTLAAGQGITVRSIGS